MTLSLLLTIELDTFIFNHHSLKRTEKGKFKAQIISLKQSYEGFVKKWAKGLG